MTNLSEYAQWSPIHKETQDTEPKKKIETKTIIAVCNLIFGCVTAVAWACMTFTDNTPWLILGPVWAMVVLLLERAFWTACHIAKESTFTDASDAYSFERTSFFLILLVWLTSISYKQFGDGECDSKPYAAVIVEKGKEVTIDINKDNTLGICEFIQNDASSTLMWALCTVPLLLLLGTDWKTLKATRKGNSEEATWVPLTALFYLWLSSKFFEEWREFSKSEKRAFKAVLFALILVATVIALIIRSS